jgi:hypothetical protein
MTTSLLVVHGGDLRRASLLALVVAWRSLAAAANVVSKDCSAGRGQTL